MATAASDKNEEYILNELIPLLVTDGKLSSNKNKLTSIKNVSVQHISSTETFMLTMCYKVQVILEDNGEETKHYLVVKRTPNIPQDMYDATGFDSLYDNEITSYTTILPALGDTSKYVMYYYSYRKHDEALIVLSDFSVEGWEMSKKRYNLSIEHVLLTVKYLAQFHGDAYALKLTNLEKFQTLTSLFRKSRFASDPPVLWGNILRWTHERLCEHVDKSELPTIIPKQFLDSLKDIFQDYVNMAKTMFKPVEPFATICHGDFLRNNIAFKYSDKNPEVPIDVVMFDFQTIVYSSPMVDLVTFMCMSAGRDAKSHQFEMVFRAYWNTLVDTVTTKSGLDRKSLPAFLSYDSMLQEYIKYYPLGIRVASFFLMEMVAPLGVTPEEFISETEDRGEYLDVKRRGGEEVDKEIRSMILELYNMSQKYNVDIFKHYEMLKTL